MTQVEGRERSRTRSAALLLPGMSLNDSIFPALDIPTISPNLSGLEWGDDGITSELRRDGFDCYVRLIDAELERSECWNDARRVIVAHSFGGMLALHWLASHREAERAQVDGLVIIGSTPGPMYERVQVRVPFPGGREWRLAVGWLVPFWNLPTTTRLAKRLMCGGRLDANPVNFQNLNIESEADLGRAGWRNVDWRALRAYRFTMQGFDVRDRLSDITVPTVVLHGTKDSLFATEDARVLADRMPAAELRLVDGADHALPVTHGSEVIQAVIDVLGG